MTSMICLVTSEMCVQFLNTPESQTLRCDLIRFIIGCIHPSNEVLCSDIIPRWAVIGWLLSSCTSPIATANCKLALFYDWLFFSGENDNIMNIGENTWYAMLICLELICFTQDITSLLCVCDNILISIIFFRTWYFSDVPFIEATPNAHHFFTGLLMQGEFNLKANRNCIIYLFLTIIYCCIWD